MTHNKYSLTPWRSALLEKPPVVQLRKNFPTFYGTQDSLPCSYESSNIPYSEPDESSPYRPIPTHLRVCLPSGLFPSGFPTEILYVFLFSPIRATCHDIRH
jgi:hypothetical protein